MTYIPVKYDPRKCGYCGREFTPKTKRSVFCSKRCKDIASRIRYGIKCNLNTEPYHKNCRICGKPFDTFRASAVTCSPECAEVNHPKPKGKRIMIPIADRVRDLYGGRIEYVKMADKDHVVLRCKVCGSIIKRTRQVVRQGTIVCELCKEQNRLQEARRKMVCFFNALAQAKTPKICAVCGEEFYSPYSTQKYCSSRCKNKKKGGKYRTRCHGYGTYYDPTVKMMDVVNRDGGVCQICGKVCDMNDHRWGSIGPDYPTVDHIIPLVRGGTHTWDNVQCACANCNSQKRDLIKGNVGQWVV